MILFLATNPRLSIIAYSNYNLFQVMSYTNSSCSNQYKNVQVISVSTNLELQPFNNNLVTLIFTKVN